MKITHHRFLAGANIYADRSMLETATDFGSDMACILAPLRADFGGLAQIGAREGGLDIAHLLDAAAKALPRQARGCDLIVAIAGHLLDHFVIEPERGRIIAVMERSIAALTPCDNARSGLAAWELACHVALAAQRGVPIAASTIAHLDEGRRAFRQIARDSTLDQFSMAMVRTARRLDIPVRVTDIGRRIVQYGHGRNARRAFETLLDTDSHFAFVQTSDKWWSLNRLRALGLPVLESALATTEDAAAEAAQRLGGAVVVKPVNAGKGNGVSVNLETGAQVREAWRLAAGYDRRVLVERFGPGDDHRLLIVGDKMIAAARRTPCAVTGDGVRSIRQLIDALNTDPLRRDDHADNLLERINIDSRMIELLAREGMSPDCVPAMGETVMLSLAANISQGGTAEDVTGAVHPDNRDAAVRAARAMNITVAGVDFISPDISRSWREAGGWILEVNAPPGLRPHWIANPGQDVVSPIIAQLFPDPAAARIPTAGVTGSLGKTTTCQMVAAIARAAGHAPGVATTQGMWSGEFRCAAGDLAGGGAAQHLLSDPMIDCGVFELARGGLVRTGMTIDAVDVAAVLNVREHHIGMDGISSSEQMAYVKAIITRNAREWVILNADDPLVLDMRKGVKRARIGLASIDPANPAIAAHRAQGGFACLLAPGADGPLIQLAEGEDVLLEMPVAEIPASSGGRSPAIAVNALFAAGIALKLGFAPDAIRAALGTFASDEVQNPGRHNLIGGLPFGIYLHWADGAEALRGAIEAQAAEAPTGKRHLFLTSPGNRDDAWLLEMGRVAAGRFDHYHCANISDLRQRAPDVAPGMLARGLRESGVKDAAISIWLDGETAFPAVLRQMEPGDRLVAFTYESEQALTAIAALRGALAGAGGNSADDR